MEPVDLGVVADSAIRIATRLALGEYVLRGPYGNILEVESRVAWATVITELEKEGYALVPPLEYSLEYGLAPEVVSAMIEVEGSLFAVSWTSSGISQLAVPLAEREVIEQLGPVPA